MGLIKAAMGAAGGVMADQWKEFFYCDALDQDTLMIKGQKRTGARSSNTKGSDNIISNGSGIAVANGQCMMIVEQGKVALYYFPQAIISYTSCLASRLWKDDTTSGSDTTNFRRQ